ncbi:MAG: phosphoribosyltransferase family protein [Saprospiraceae bacterium]|nr:phosphoribosyltransferase family protein [Candidatus Defluviibacterium haderslevense]
MRQSYSLHKINNPDSFTFEPAEYSRFKFGDDSIAELYGRNLAINFIKEILSIECCTNQIVVISSPYSFIPTATFALKNHFINALNHWLVKNSYQVVQETKIHRTITYKEDYGELNAEQRIKLIGNDFFHIDKEFIKDKTLIFLDDIRITGSHERMISKMLDQYQIKNNSYLLYFAELINSNIHPNIENYLNYYSIKSIFDLDYLIESEDFIINTRVVKFILNNDNRTFKLFIQNKKSKFLNLLYFMAIGNGYHNIDVYSCNIITLQNEIKQSLLIPTI